jgi:hypothetical protein
LADGPTLERQGLTALQGANGQTGVVQIAMACIPIGSATLNRNRAGLVFHVTMAASGRGTV